MIQPIFDDDNDGFIINNIIKNNVSNNVNVNDCRKTPIKPIKCIIIATNVTTITVNRFDFCSLTNDNSCTNDCLSILLFDDLFIVELIRIRDIISS